MFGCCITPTMGPTVVEQCTTEILPSSTVSQKASVTRLAPETSMVPKLSDVLLDLRDLPDPIYDALRGVPDTQSTPQLTARALRALRRDNYRTNRECSLPLTTVPQRTP